MVFDFSFDEEFLDLRNDYVKSLQDTIKEIETLFLKLEEKSDPETYKQITRIIHTVKGSAASYGLNFASTLCHKFEDYLNSENINCITFSNHTNKLLKFLDLLRDYINNLSKENETDIKSFDEQLLSLTHKDSKSNHKVLIVEPSQNLCRQYIKILNKYNVDVSLAQNGYEALGRLLQEHFDSLITSAKVGFLDGQSLTSSIRIINSKNRKIITILVTSDDSINIIEQFKPTFLLKKSPEFFRELEDVFSTITI